MKIVLALVTIEGLLVWRGMDILIFGILCRVLFSFLFGHLLSRDATQGPSNFQLSLAAVTTMGNGETLPLEVGVKRVQSKADR